MSTRIYNAWMWSGTAEELIKVFDKLKYAYMVESVHLLEKYCISEVIGSNSPFDITRYLWKTKECSGQEIFDLTFSAVVFFHGGRIVVKFVGLELYSNLYSLIDGHSKFSDYSYWNITDKPDGVTEKEWAEREDFYDSVFGPRYVRGVDVGLSFDWSDRQELQKIAFMYHKRAQSKRQP